jgi:EAL domain-containing protein (putative c-di-GMP-specific phosphodiesterase class I)
MERRPPTEPIDYRTAYLKMRSVLHDRTTDLPALPLLFDRLRSWLDDRPALGLLHFEIADLGMVESLYGWQVFDGIVASVAQALRDSIGAELPAGSLVALNGVAGDRFVVFLPPGPGAPATELALTADAVRGRLERTFAGEAFAGLNPALCFRAGQAWLRLDPFFRFERCVYAAIDEARGAHERRERRRELSWGDELRGILRSGSVHALFQPVVELASRSVLGHEALARGPRDSLFESPRAMFALSERMGVGAELDRLCHETALAASGALPLRGKLFLNLSHGAAADGLGPDDPLELARQRHGLAAEDLVVEVSERATGADPVTWTDRLRRLRQAGYGVALDDVGTGRTRLETIRRIEPDYLKIDPSLVRGLHRSLMQQEIVATLVGLAASAGGSVIGEGVEHEAEAAALVRGGARYGQGHLFATPAAAAACRAAERKH